MITSFPLKLGTRGIMALLGLTLVTSFVTATSFVPSATAQQVPDRSTIAPQNIGNSSIGLTAPLPERVISAETQQLQIALNKMISVRVPAGSIVVIGNPDVVQVIGPNANNRTHVNLFASEIGSTSIVIENDKGNILFTVDVQVNVDISGIQTAITEMLPDEKIKVVSHRNSVFLKGFVRSAAVSNGAVNIARKFVEDPIEVVNTLEILGSQQVVMQVRVAEIKRTALKGLGVDLGLGAGNVFSGSTTQTSLFNKIGHTAFAAASISSLGKIAGLTSISINALEDQGLAKTLAEPTLTALSGETASFLAGGSFPMPVSYDAATGTITFEQKPFGVALNFTPVVMDKGRISLRVKSTVSDRDDSVAVTTTFGTIPGLTEKTTETTVELPSGGSIMMAGLIQNDMLNYVEGVPGLKDLPIIGQLFRSEGFKNEETELVVLITAYLAAPASNSAALGAPTDGFAPSDDLDFYLLGRLHKRYAKTELPPYATPLTGPYGYIME